MQDVLQLVGLRSFRSAGLTLIGLLIYDVFWVFGSPSVIGQNVMLKVATSDLITGPTRILFPKVSEHWHFFHSWTCYAHALFHDASHTYIGGRRCR